MRERVLTAARSLNFTPNALIRSLQTGRTNAIGIFTWSIGREDVHDVSMRLLRGITEALSKGRADALIYAQHPDDGTRVDPTSFLDGRIDGLIIVSGGLSHEGLSMLAAAGLPTAALYQGEPPAGMAAVNIDNEAGIDATLEHLSTLGHRRIALLAPAYNHDFQARIRAYRAGLSVRGIALDPDLAPVIDDADRATCRRLVDEWLAMANPPTAVIAGYDQPAYHVLDRLEERGVPVPDGMSVVGFDDAPMRWRRPALTTVRQPALDVGRQAAEYVLRCVNGEDAGGMQCVLPVSLVVRETTGPPRQGGMRA